MLVDGKEVDELPAAAATTAAETPVATVHVAQEAGHDSLNETLSALNGSIAALNIAVSSIHEELKNAHATAAPIVEPAVAPAAAAAAPIPEEIAPEVVPPAAETRKVRRNGRLVKRG